MENFDELTLENFLNIFEYVKYTKKKWFKVDIVAYSLAVMDINIYGTDDDFSSVSYIENVELQIYGDNQGCIESKEFYVISNISIYFNKNEIVALLKDNSFSYIKNHTIYDQMGYSKLWVGESTISSKLDKLAFNAHTLGVGINPYNRNLALDKIYYLEDMRQNEDITSSLSMKAGDGMNMINLNNHIITLYGGMYPITAKDKVSITLYDLHDGSNVSIVRIIKKKPKEPKDLEIVCVLRYRSLVN